MHQSFINFRHYRYGLIAGVASLQRWLRTCWTGHASPERRHVARLHPGHDRGAAGHLSGALRIRKRSFRSTIGTAIGWLSAHVYLGLAALLIATLHSGMHFGRNVHTVAYVLMCLVTLSGCWGCTPT